MSQTNNNPDGIVKLPEGWTLVRTELVEHLLTPEQKAARAERQKQEQQPGVVEAPNNPSTKPQD